MKKILILISIVLISVIGYSQGIKKDNPEFTLGCMYPNNTAFAEVRVESFGGFGLEISTFGTSNPYGMNYTNIENQIDYSNLSYSGETHKKWQGFGIYYITNPTAIFNCDLSVGIGILSRDKYSEYYTNNINILNNQLYVNSKSGDESKTYISLGISKKFKYFYIKEFNRILSSGQIRPSIGIGIIL